MIKLFENILRRYKSKNSNLTNDTLIIIDSKIGWKFIGLNELKEYRDLFYFLVWKDIKALYAQTILGFSWAIINPFVQIVIFTFIFGKIAKLDTNGIPYVLFSTLGIVPWTYMSQAMVLSAQSLVSGQHLLGKVYFPRLIFPLTPVLSRLLDFGISMVLVLCAIIYFRISPSYNMILFPVFVLLMVSISAGVGMWLSTLAIRFRDIKHAMGFGIRMLMYSAPIVYSSSSVPEKFQFIYSLNPLVAVIEGYRACLLGTPFPWHFIWPGMLTTFILLISGTLYFKHMERIVVDVI
jgi:lipopolysaccharide transport system permease protein